MKSLLIISFTLFSAFAINAQGWLSQGARVGAMANNGVTLIDAFSYHHNPGALGFVEKGTVGMSYESRYDLKEIQCQCAAVAVPLTVTIILLGVKCYGYQSYRRTRSGLGYSTKMSETISAGVLT